MTIRLVLLVLLTPSALAAADAVPLFVRLRTGEVDGSRPVRLQDVADIVGGGVRERMAAAMIDLADPPAPGRSLAIPRTLIRQRLALEPIGRQVKLIGLQIGSVRNTSSVVAAAATADADRQSESVAVAAVAADAADAIVAAPAGSDPWDEAPNYERQVLDRIKTELAQRLNLPESELIVQLTSPFPSGWETGLQPHSVQLVPHVAPEPSLGRNNVQVSVFHRDRLNRMMTAQLDVQATATIVVAARPLTSGRVLQEGDLTTKQVFLQQGRPELLTVDELLGRRLRRRVRSGEKISEPQLGPDAGEDERLVFNQEPVELQAVKNGLTVTLHNAQAMQDGKLNELIRVRNLDSRRTVMGRVVDHGLVQIDLDPRALRSLTGQPRSGAHATRFRETSPTTARYAGRSNASPSIGASR